MIVVNGKDVPCEEVTAVRVHERGLEFLVEHAKRSASTRTERLHVRMDSRSEFRLWRDALRPTMASTSGASTSRGDQPE